MPPPVPPAPERWRELLTRHDVAGYDLDGTQLAEAIWLAAQRSTPAGPSADVTVLLPTAEAGAWTGGQNPEPLVPEAAAPAPASATPAPRTADETQPRQVASRRWMTGRRPAAGQAPELGRTAPGAAEAIGVGGRRGDQTALFRALRPLKRSCARPRRAELDERRTAELSAEAGSLVLSFRQRDERWLDLAVLVDVSASMTIWQGAVDELIGVLTRLGAFREVTTWAFDADAATAEPRFRPLRRGAAARAGTARTAQALTRSPRPRVFLVISDGVGPAWRNAALTGALGYLARRSPVSLVDPLPHRMWHRSGIRAEPMYQRVTGAADALAIRHYRTPWSPREPRRWLPVWHLAADELGAWARLMVGAGDRARPGLAMSAGPAQGDQAPPGGAVAGGPPAEAVARFRALASSAAFRLATRLAAVPLSLPVIRMIQDAVAGTDGTDQLAEVLLSGLLVRTAARSPGEDPDQVVYDFAPGVREQLLGALTRTEVIASLHAVALAPAPAARPFGGTLNFRLLTDPDGVTRPLPERARHFANVAVVALGSLGPAYAGLASGITARLASGPADDFRLIRDGHFGGATVTLTIIQVDGPARSPGDGAALADLLADRIEADPQARPDLLVACENLVSAATTVEVARSAAFFGQLLARFRFAPERLILAPAPSGSQGWGAYEYARAAAGRAATALLAQAIGCLQPDPGPWWRATLADQVPVTVLDSTQIAPSGHFGALGERQLAWLRELDGGRPGVVVMHHDPASRLADVGAFYDAVPAPGLVIHGWGPSASGMAPSSRYAGAPAIPEPDAGFLVFRISGQQVAIRGRHVLPEPASRLAITSPVAFSAYGEAPAAGALQAETPGARGTADRERPVRLADPYSPQMTLMLGQL